MWLVEFYAQRCYHCEKFEPVYEQLAQEYKPFMNLGAV